MLIPKPTMSTVSATMQGVTPGLLLNPFGRKAEEQLLASMQKKVAKVARADKDPAREYEERLAEVTVDAEKHIFWTNVLAFKSAMLRGAKSMDKLPMTVVREGVFVIPDSVVDGQPRAHVVGTAEPYSTHVRNQGGSVDYRTRVLLSTWTYRLDFQVNTAVMSVDQALTCLVNAGVGTGIGDWRPEKNGVHGRWTVTDAEVK